MEKNIKEIREQFKKANINQIEGIIKEYAKDNRKGVIKILENNEKKLKKYKKELDRMKNMQKYENDAYNNGKKTILGIDEVGRGSLAGPVVTAGVILPKDTDLLYINDSKKLSSEKRKELYYKIYEAAIEISVNFEDNEVIDGINILNATKKSMLKNIATMKNAPDYLILDGINLKTNIPYISIPKADEKSVSVACASIIAKVTRDTYMEKMHSMYPKYNFYKNKGYGVFEHMEAIKKYGVCEIHRRTFIKGYL